MPPSAPTVPSIVMAGGKDSAAFTAVGEDPRPGMAEIHGRPMLVYVFEALRQASGIESVTLVAHPDLPEMAGVDRRVAPAGGMAANVAAGLGATPGKEDGVFLTTADAPFLTAAAVDDFLARSREAGAPLCYAVVARQANEARFPEMRRTYARLREGEFTGGNAFFLRPEIWPGVERVLNQAHEARKKPWRIAALLGPQFIWRFLRHSLTIAEAEARIGQLLGGPCRAIVTPYAELGADVDEPEALATARRLLSPLP